MNSDPEITLLSECMVVPNAIQDAAVVLKAEDFSRKEYASLFTAMRELNEEGQPGDWYFVSDRLKAKGMKDSEIGDLIATVADGQPVMGPVKAYARKVLELAKRRKITGLLQSSAIRGEQGDDPAQIMRETSDAFQDIQSERSPTDVVRLDSVSRDVLNELAALREGDDSLLGIQTGINELDSFTGGIQKGELWIVGALPGRGKTAFATQVAMAAVAKGVPVLYFSLEMNTKEIERRVLSAEVGTRIIRNPRFSSQAQFREVIEVAATLEGLPLFVDDSSALKSSELVLRARRAIRKQGIGLLIVDYLQLVSGRGKELRERVGEAGNALRELAKETQVPVIALSQLSRSQNINDVPTMMRLKESGDLEAHAHTVLLLHTPIGDDRQPTREDEIIIGKQRNGAVGSAPVTFDRKNLVFRSRQTQ